MSLSLAEAIEKCVELKPKIEEKHHHFIDDMASSLARFGKEFVYATRKQQHYIRSLVAQFDDAPKPEIEEKPKSNLEKLREKRAAIIHRINVSEGRRRRRRHKAMDIEIKLANGELQVSDAPTARMRHAKSMKREMTGNRLLITHTKRD